MKKNILVLTVLIMALLFIIIARNVYLRRNFSKNDAEIAVPVEVAKAKRMNLWEKVWFTGDVKGYYEAQIFPKVPGKLKTRVKDVGESVASAEETIAMIDRDEPALEYAPAEVKAPFAGVITRYLATEGEMVSPARPLAEIASVDRIKIVGQISERDINKIKVGQKVEFVVEAYPETKFTGEVARISQSLDAYSRTATIEVVSENSRKSPLKPGMFAKAQVLIRISYGAIVVPRQAVIYNPSGENLVFVVGDDNRAFERKVRVGLESSDMIEILSGIKEGESVVTLGQYNLSEGKIVEVVK